MLWRIVEAQPCKNERTKSGMAGMPPRHGIACDGDGALSFTAVTMRIIHVAVFPPARHHRLLAWNG